MSLCSEVLDVQVYKEIS